jgi:aspartate/tyrosine/aromatic aminotransferase
MSWTLLPKVHYINDATYGISTDFSFACQVNSERRNSYFTMLCSVLCEDEKQAVAVKSQLQQLGRPMYSNPPVQGAFIVSTVLGDPELKTLWLKEVKVNCHSN